MRHLAPSAFVRRLFLYLAAGATFLLLTQWASAADAASAPFRVLDAIDATYKPFQTTWYNAIKGYATDLFWLLDEAATRRSPVSPCRIHNLISPL